MEPIQWVGVVLIVAGIAWAFLHPKEAGAGEVDFKGLSAKGLTQGGILAALGVVLMLAPLAFGNNDGSAGSATTSTTASSSACLVSGTVYERDSGRAFAGVDVGLVPPGSAFTDEEHFSEQATTDPSGRFEFGCDQLAGSETQVLALSYAGWGGCLNVTKREITRGEHADGVTLYVSQRVQETLGKLFGLPRNDNCTRVGEGNGLPG